MPKMKTKKAAAKRFMARGSGSIKRAHANKRQLRGTLTVHESDIQRVRDMMPYA